MNDKLDKIRRATYQKENDENKRRVIKGQRWILLCNGEGLDESGQQRLHAALQANEPLAKAYYRYEAENEGVLVAYASIHGGTAEAANLIGEKLRQMGCPKVVVSDLSRDDIAEVIEDAFRYPRLVCCAASYDANVFPPMHDFLWHLQIKNYQNRRIALLENGSWAPCAGKAMKALIKPMKNITLVEPMVTIRSRMKASDLPAIDSLCQAILAD